MTLDRNESSIMDEGYETSVHSGTRRPSLGSGSSAESSRSSHIDTPFLKPIDCSAHDDWLWKHEEVDKSVDGRGSGEEVDGRSEVMRKGTGKMKMKMGGRLRVRRGEDKIHCD